MLFFWMMPFLSDWTLGNDYPRYSIWNQLELMFSFKTGSFPLYVPGFAGGHSASALTLGQIYHPLPYLASVMPGYWQGYALELNTFLRLLTLGLAHWITFGFIQRLNIQATPALALSMITVYNLRMLDLFRYAASLESWTGFIVLCSAIGCYYLDPKRKRWLVVMVAATYWLVCSGHPQMSYYGLSGAGIFAVVIPSFVKQVRAAEVMPVIPRTRFIMTVFFCLLIGILISTAYIFPFYFDFIQVNATRVAQGYSWADGYRDTLAGTLNNFFFPLRSDVHGAFGGSLLYLVAIMLPIIALFKVKIPRTIWIIWMIVAFVFLYMQGERTALHYTAWKYVPFISSFRIAGRISMIMPMLLLLLLVWIVKNDDRLKVKILKNETTLNSGAFLASLAIVALGIFALMPPGFKSDMTTYSAVNIRNIPLYVEYGLQSSAIAALMCFAAYANTDRFKYLTGFLLCTFSCLTLMGYLYQGSWIEKKRPTPTFQKIYDEKRDRLDYRRPAGYGLITQVVQRQIEESCLEPFLGKIYCNYSYVEDNDRAYRYLAKGRAPDEIIVEAIPNKAPADTVSHGSIPRNRVDLIYASFNKLAFTIHSECSGFFGLAYPYTGHWRATVNGQRVDVHRANGAANAVKIPAGAHEIEFRYWSDWAFWGMLVSLLTFTLAGCALAISIRDRWLAVCVSCLVIATGIGISWAWYHSLYRGENLHTAYHWSAESLPALPNLAYNKRAYYHDQGAGQWSLMSYGGLAVDGDYRPMSGFKSAFMKNPYWVVDLHNTARIGSIILYESYTGDKWNRRPLKILFSQNGKDWHQAAAVNDKSFGQAIKTEFPDPVYARYVMVKATGASRLGFDELEIFASDRQ